jgi:hypothetical protein
MSFLPIDDRQSDQEDVRLRLARSPTVLRAFSDEL